MKKYQVETYNEEILLVDRQWKTLMQLRVFCEQEMYPKLHSGELNSILIMHKPGYDEEEK